MDTLQIIAEPRRRDILALVWNHELPVAAIASHTDVTLSAVSQHLAIMREAGLVTMRKDGNRHLYRADHDALGPFKDVLETMWRSGLARLAGEIEAAEGSTSD